jgi:light-independent protochlorophyllide reductase subunit N
MQDAFFLVVGSRTCAHLLQSAAGVMIFAEPRFATAILQDRDLAGMADCNDELDRVVASSWRAARISAPCSWWAPARRRSSSSTCHGRQAPESTARRARVRILAYSGSGIETTFTQGEDTCLTALVAPGCRHRRAALLVAGTLPDIVEDQFRACSTNWASVPVHFLPARRMRRYAAGGARHPLLLAQPFLTETAAALTKRGASCSRALPLRCRGHARLAAAAAQAWDVSREHFDAVCAAPDGPRQARRRRAARKARRARASASCRTRSLRCRWRASCSASADATGDQRGVPFHDPQHHGRGAVADPRRAAHRGRRRREAQLDAVRDSAARTSRSAASGIANPLEAEGLARSGPSS